MKIYNLDKKKIRNILECYEGGNSLQRVSGILDIGYWKIRKIVKNNNLLRTHSEAGKIMKNVGQFKKGHKSWNKGRVLLEETKKKISIGKIKNHRENPDIYERISKGTKEGMKNVPYKKLAYWLGKKNPEHGEWVSKNQSRENHWNWQGGKSFESYGEEFNETLKKSIRARDDYKCQQCCISQEELGYALDIHHIDSNKQNNSSDNLISFCRSCHISLEVASKCV